MKEMMKEELDERERNKKKERIDMMNKIDNKLLH